MKKIFSTLLLLLSLTAGLRAQDYNGLWHSAPANFAGERGLPALHPERFASFTVAEAALKEYLTRTTKDPEHALIIDLPVPEGGYRSFRFWNTPAMEDGLAAKYPDINTYTAEATNDHRVTAKLDYTPFGFHAMVYDGGRTYLIDPYAGAADGAYIAYYKGDYSRPLAQRMSCNIGDDESLKNGRLSLTNDGLPGLQRLNGTTRKTYRLALACTGEYAAAVAGFSPAKAAVLAKMVTTMNRVNGVYEREVAVTMVIVSSNTSIIFTDGATDPYTNNSGSTMLGENQTAVNTAIGTANYDIGHVFSTGGGGIAQKGSVCVPGYKARGVTGSPSPVGDAFDIDYVAHEMGHQFGADHTFNANTGSCAGNGEPTTAYEPGSGSTIMAYAGICTGNDFQAHSDAYFHSASLEEISDFITTGNGSFCPATSASTNTNATVPAYAVTYTIPNRTPFELTAPAATDATANTLTYCWEQRDLGDFQKTLVQTRLAGPIFRSFTPDTSRTRVFPQLSKLVTALPPVGEKLPDTGRTLHFRFTERDVYQGWGTFNFPDDAVTLQVIRTTAPFTVTAPVDGDSWTGGDLKTVIWNVVGTNAAPISCANVDIFLSLDDGYTYPYKLKTATPNDGSEAVRIPNVATTSSARIKVKGSNNVFFNISDGAFTIVHGTVGVAPSPLADNITISPVPAKDVVHVSIPAALGAMQVQVINPVGQTVWNGTLSGNAALPVAEWARGVYLMKMYNDSGVQLTRRIVVD